MGDSGVSCGDADSAEAGTMVWGGGPDWSAAGGGDRRHACEGLLAGEEPDRTACALWQELAADRDRWCSEPCAEGFAGGGGEQGRDLPADGAAACGRSGVCGADEDG